MPGLHASACAATRCGAAHALRIATGHSQYFSVSLSLTELHTGVFSIALPRACEPWHGVRVSGRIRVLWHSAQGPGEGLGQQHRGGREVVALTCAMGRAAAMCSAFCALQRAVGKARSEVPSHVVQVGQSCMRALSKERSHLHGRQTGPEDDDSGRHKPRRPSAFLRSLPACCQEVCRRAGKLFACAQLSGTGCVRRPVKGL